MPFCTGCGTTIETGTKCDDCMTKANAVPSTKQFSENLESGLGNWLNEMLSTLKNLLSGNLDRNWVMNNSLSSIWGAIGTAAVLTGIVAILLTKSVENLLGGFAFGLGLVWFSAPKAFFLGLLGMAVIIGGLFGALYIIMAIGKSKASSWNLLGLTAYAGLLLSLALLIAFIGGKIIAQAGIVLLIIGFVVAVQIIYHGLEQLSDISRTSTFYAVPIAIAVSFLLFTVYISIWTNW